MESNAIIQLSPEDRARLEGWVAGRKRKGPHRSPRFGEDDKKQWQRHAQELRRMNHPAIAIAAGAAPEVRRSPRQGPTGEQIDRLAS
jgi:hypothetical protein